MIDENTSIANIYGYEVLVAVGSGAFIQVCLIVLLKLSTLLTDPGWLCHNPNSRPAL